MEAELFVPEERFRGYVVVRKLGKGGLGEVWLVRHELLDTLYALKVLSRKIANGNPEYVKRFMREAKIASRIRHPNLVSVHDVGYDESKGVHYLVMDYVSGGDLRTAIAMGGAKGHREAVRIIASVASALAAGEPFGIVHRDIKPENIMLEPDGTVRLVDMGVAKVHGTDSLKTAPQTVFGTPSYMAPEQALDSSTVDARADVWSLGVVLFELLTGKTPYAGMNQVEQMGRLLSDEPLPDVCSVNPEVSAKMSVLIGLMCAKKPESRISGATALLEMLEKFGYEVNVSAKASYAADVSSEEKPVDYAEIMKRTAVDTLSFETEDEEIRQFVDELKRKKRGGAWWRFWRR